MNYIFCVIILGLCLIICSKIITNCFITCKTSHKQIIELFEYFLCKSYDCIYESDIISYVSQGITNLPQNQRETLERNYVKQTLTFMGINNIKLFVKFFGSQETIVINIIQYMRKRFNEDGLIKMIESKNNEDNVNQQK